MVFGRRVENRCCLAAFACAFLLAGCAEFHMVDTLPLIERASKPKAPVRATAMWTDTILNQSRQVGVRGFGGRVMFYDADSKEPIIVDGTVTVYAFDESDPKAHLTIPKRKYVFTPEQLPDHYSKSKLGHSYSFWLPWDEVGGPPQQISLILRFEGRSGGVLMTDSSRQLLPGILAEHAKPDSPAAVDGQDVSLKGAGENVTLNYVELAGADKPSHIHLAVQEAPAEKRATVQRTKRPADKEAMSTVTIDVPPSFAQRNLTALTYLDVVAESDIPGDSAASRQQTLRPIPHGQRESTPVEFTDERTGNAGRTGRDAHREASRPAAPSTNVSTAVSSAASRTASRSARYALPRSRVRREPIVRPDDGPVRRQPRRATWPFALPPTPRSPRIGGWSHSYSADQKESN